MDIKHLDGLSWFSRKGESHEQDGERLCRARVPRAKQRLAILPMAFMSSIGCRVPLGGPDWWTT
jgi:hypothetical protein